jgi:hypothetical protein
MELRVQFTKRADGNAILRCTRQDNSVTWQRYDNQAAFFVHHDLSHFAVETLLNLREGFFGLIAGGWDITDTTGKGARGALPAASAIAEYAVGIFTMERVGSSAPLTAEAFNAQIEQLIGKSLSPGFSDPQLDGVRNKIADLYRRWAAVPPGSSLDLTFG